MQTKGWQWDHALALLKTMSIRMTWPNAASYSAAMSACVQGEVWEMALQLFQECKTWVTPDTVSYSAAITAYEKGG